MSASTASDPPPLSGRVIAIGRISGGMPMGPRTGRRPLIIHSIAPDARNIPIAKRIATRYGMMRTATLNPSFAPVTNSSYTATRLISP